MTADNPSPASLTQIEARVMELTILVNRLQDQKAEKEELFRLRQEMASLRDTLLEVKYALTEIKNNSVEDRDVIRKLTEKLAPIEEQLVFLDAFMRDLQRTHEKIDQVIETSWSYQIGKIGKSICGLLTRIKSINKAFHFTITAVEYGFLAFIVYYVLTAGAYVLGRPFDLDKLIELIRVLRGG